MAKISVTRADNTTFVVAVQDETQTQHTVTVKPAYAKQLVDGKSSVEDLVAASFKFLLEREPNTSILRQFDLSVISNYFPDYESRIHDYL
jgi:hypothetical protein